MNFRQTIAALGAAALLAGCASTSMSFSSPGSPARGAAPVSGSSYTSASVSGRVSSNAWFGLLFLGAYAASAQDSYTSWSFGPGGTKPPQLAEDRAIAERDCSLPMAQTGANLRCK